jgi:hypothetical protein
MSIIRLPGPCWFPLLSGEQPEPYQHHASCSAALAAAREIATGTDLVPHADRYTEPCWIVICASCGRTLPDPEPARGHGTLHATSAASAAETAGDEGWHVNDDLRTVLCTDCCPCNNNASHPENVMAPSMHPAPETFATGENSTALDRAAGHAVNAYIAGVSAPLRYLLSVRNEQARRRRRRMRHALRRYEHQLRALRTVSAPAGRANRLDIMALYAETLSADERRERETQAWAATADILRAIAATERGCVLTSLDQSRRDGPAGTAARPLWQALACARSERAARAGFLAELCASYITEPGVLVLDDIADTELAIAAAPCPAHGWRDRLRSGPPDYRAAPELTAPGDRHA